MKQSQAISTRNKSGITTKRKSTTRLLNPGRVLNSQTIAIPQKRPPSTRTLIDLKPVTVLSTPEPTQGAIIATVTLT